jgi:hypothetical protein
LSFLLYCFAKMQQPPPRIKRAGAIVYRPPVLPGNSFGFPPPRTLCLRPMVDRESCGSNPDFGNSKAFDKSGFFPRLAGLFVDLGMKSPLNKLDNCRGTAQRDGPTWG